MNDDREYIKDSVTRLENLMLETFPPLTRLLVENIIQQAIWEGVDQERAKHARWLEDAEKGRGRA